MLKHDADYVYITNRQQSGLLPARQCYRRTDRQLDSKEEQETVNKRVKIVKEKINKVCKERKESKCENECNEKGRNGTRINVSGEAAASVFRLPLFNSPLRQDVINIALLIHFIFILTVTTTTITTTTTTTTTTTLLLPLLLLLVLTLLLYCCCLYY